MVGLILSDMDTKRVNFEMYGRSNSNLSKTLFITKSRIEKGNEIMFKKNRILVIALVCLMLMESLLVVGCGSGSSGVDNDGRAKDCANADNEAASNSSNTKNVVASNEAGNSVAENAGSSEPATMEPVELTILAAASLTDVCNEIKEKYEAEHENVTLNFSYGGSGALQTQIEEGAPADVFISAATKQMNALDEQGVMDTASIVQLLENKVVLVVPAGSTADISSFEDVATDKVTMVGLGEPGSVPVGQYSEEIFTTLGVLDTVKDKANYGSDVRTVLSWVETSAVDCGIVYATDAYTTELVKIVAEAPQGSCKQVIYPAGIVKSSENAEAAAEFMAYLQKEEIRVLFENYGFTKVDKF